MKELLIKLCIGALALTTLSCGDDLPVYEDVSRVYFNWVRENPATNSKLVSFGYETPMKADSVIRLDVRLQGRLSDQDRPITAEVIRHESSAVAGEEIVILDSSYMPANSHIGRLYVKLLNTDKLLTQTVSARIRLTPNEAFHTDFNLYGTYSALEYNLTFDAKTEMPNLWKDVTISPSFTQLFLAWSRTKELALYQAFGVDREWFSYHPELGETANDVMATRITSVTAYSFVAIFNRWLNAYKAGTTYMDGSPKPAGEPLKDGLDGKVGNEIKTSSPSMF